MARMDGGRRGSPKTVYDVLDQVRTRPGMFLGEASIVALQAFTSGLTWSELSPGRPSFWDFNRWASAVIDGSTGPWHLMESRLGSAATLDRYFRYLDRYRSCREVTLARATRPFVSHTISVSPSGVHSPMPAPHSVVVGRFIPSPVFYVASKNADGIEKHGQFFRSKSAAMRHAEQAWSFSSTRWRLSR